MLAAALAVLGFALLLPGRAAPMHDRTSDTVTVTMSAPAHVLHGNHYDYTITFTYSGVIVGDHTPDYSVTDALPGEVLFLGAGMSPQGLCPTLPPSGQNGSVGCSFNFSANARTITLTITVLAAMTGSVTNTAQVASVGTASATTSIAPAPAGSITATLTGPETIQLSSTTAPPRFNYKLVLGYTGPPIRGAVFARLVERLPEQMSSPGVALGAEGIRDQCQGDSLPKRLGGTLTCNILFEEDHRTNTIQLSVRPTGVVGSATNTIELSTGDTATWTTTVLAPPAEPPPSAPPSVAGPSAAPTATKTETFTTAGDAEPETVTISPTAETVQVALTWPSGSSFDATGFTLTSGSRTLAVSEKLRITKKRGARWLDVRIKGVHKGKLKFKIVAKRVHGRTRVVAKIRQSKR
ncbi:MAG TPA: hypothetical protein VF232_05720 [Gaiellaceae bacterium]